MCGKWTPGSAILILPVLVLKTDKISDNAQAKRKLAFLVLLVKPTAI